MNRGSQTLGGPGLACFALAGWFRFTGWICPGILHGSIGFRNLFLVNLVLVNLVLVAVLPTDQRDRAWCSRMNRLRRAHPRRNRRGSIDRFEGVNRPPVLVLLGNGNPRFGRQNGKRQWPGIKHSSHVARSSLRETQCRRPSPRYRCWAAQRCPGSSPRFREVPSPSRCARKNLRRVFVTWAKERRYTLGRANSTMKTPTSEWNFSSMA